MLYRKVSLDKKVKNPLLKPILNEKVLFHDMVMYASHANPSRHCSSASCIPVYTPSSLAILRFFTNHKSQLFVPCQRHDRFSFCQEYFLFQFNASSSTCQRFTRQPCTPHIMLLLVDVPAGQVTGVTLTFQLSCRYATRLIPSLNRMDRFPYILQRWNGPISVAFFVTEAQVAELAEILAEYSGRNILFTVYVQKDITNQNTPWHVLSYGKKQFYPKGMYPINLLRDLTIESISTSHYLVIDVDIFLSATTFDNLKKYKPLLKDERHVLLFPLFSYYNNDTKSVKKPSKKQIHQSEEKPFNMDEAAFICYKTNNCKEA